ncbi:alpha/beta-hydrolase [Durotheca rogersii]|uniref:alpha/beta-hydrolase n=1 Tax=Durotheca rogersii TaxID=419775 RepID=UPI002220A70A|nr:alpha/beta-hydrolase [Durotheca rogersii]KAI5865182.1 alpha/beta-hydrolase [Durotheca rogersii]
MLKNPTSAIAQFGRQLVVTIARIQHANSTTGSFPKLSISAEDEAADPPSSIPFRKKRQPMIASRRPQPAPGGDKFPTKPSADDAMLLGIKDAVHQWWNRVSPTVAERNVISCIPYLREAAAADTSPLAQVPSAAQPGQTQTSAEADPYGPRLWRSTMVPLSGKERSLNEFSVERVGEEVDNTLVMLHGYGAGLGFYYQNFENLSRSQGWKLYALDWLGMGNSTRPPFKVHSKDPAEKITEAENWFIDALEEWRKIRQINKFTLLGHSLGGYLGVSYALKYPGRVNKLILASPVGIPEDPYAVNADMPEPTESSFLDELAVDQQTTTTAKNDQRPDAGAPKKRPYSPLLVWLWDANVSPFSFVRLTGPLGPKFASGWTSRRFNHLTPEERQTLHDYAYSIFRQKGSGEYAMPYLLAPGAHARRPVINRVHRIGRQVITPATETAPAVRETGIPVIFMYGENDWMDVAGGLAAEEKLKQAKIKALLHGTEEEKRRENGSAKVVVVRKAGHHLYLDNPDEFNEHVRQELQETRQRTLWERSLS